MLWHMPVALFDHLFCVKWKYLVYQIIFLLYKRSKYDIVSKAKVCLIKKYLPYGLYI